MLMEDKIKPIVDNLIAVQVASHKCYGREHRVLDDVKDLFYTQQVFAALPELQHISDRLVCRGMRRSCRDGDFRVWKDLIGRVPALFIEDADSCKDANILIIRSPQLVDTLSDKPALERCFIPNTWHAAFTYREKEATVKQKLLDRLGIGAGAKKGDSFSKIMLSGELGHYIDSRDINHAFYIDCGYASARLTYTSATEKDICTALDWISYAHECVMNQ